MTQLFRLFSIMQMPRTVPPWNSLIADLGHPKPELIARALGVGRSTVYRWNSAGAAPRVAALAMFWLTRWGRSEIDAKATNDALMAVQLARSLADTLAALRAQPVRQGDCPHPASAQKRAGKTRAAGGDFCVVGTKTSPPSKLRLSRARSKPHAKKPMNPRKG